MTDTPASLPIPVDVSTFPSPQTNPHTGIDSDSRPGLDGYDRPRRRVRELAPPVLLLIASIVTTTAIGARFMQNFLNGLPAVTTESDLWPWPWLIAHPANFALGWPFSCALLGILITHELGHYFACRAHGIDATLPWVLPAPTLSGTAGAVIRIRSRIPSRQALMDVGIYGPLAGYVASLIAVAIGFSLSSFDVVGPAGRPPTLITFGQPLTLGLVHAVLASFNSDIPSFDIALRHPVLIAGWIGLFITSLNLIPGGQLDGGHILYALSPRLHRACTWLVPVLLIVMGFFSWIGWILWGLILFIPAMRHPHVGIQSPLGRGRLLLGATALILFVLTFSVAPFSSNSILYYLMPNSR